MTKGIEAVPDLVVRLYDIVNELESHFEGRSFTPDGHLVGSLGEVLAAHAYGLTLYSASVAVHDGLCPAGREVQVKATQGKSIGIRAEPEHLLVLKLDRTGGFEEVYNGPGGPAWAAAGRMQKNGQRAISTSKLARLMETVDPSERLPTTSGARG